MAVKSFIIVLKEDVSSQGRDKLIEEMSQKGIEIKQVYDGTVLNGFVIKCQEKQLEGFSDRQEIESIEPDGIVGAY